MSIITNQLVNTTDITPFINSQIPDFYFNDGPDFVNFINAYYKWLHQPGNVGYEIRTLLQNRSIDNVDPDLLTELFFKDVVPSAVNIGDIHLHLKHILDVYTQKGTPASFELLFKMLYNADVTVTKPGDEILKASDGKWYQPYYIEVDITSTTEEPRTYIKQYIGAQLVGTQSKASAYFEDFTINYVNGRLVIVIFITKPTHDFIPGEQIYGNNQKTNIIVSGSLGYVLVQSGGSDFNVGDVLDIKSSYGIDGQAEVIQLYNEPGLISFSIKSQGQGYGANTTVTIALANNAQGSGASFQIGPIVTTDVITLSTDFVQPYLNTALNATAYGFPNNPSANLNSTLSSSLNFINYPVGPITSLVSIKPGAGYTSNVIVTVQDPLVNSLQISDNHGGVWGNDAIIEGITSTANNSIRTVKVINSGVSYRSNEFVTLVNPTTNNAAYGYTGLSGVGKSVGSWSSQDGLLDSQRYIQDSDYYQYFSYVLNTNISPDVYGKVVKDNIHPVGYKQFNIIKISDTQPGVNTAAVSITGLTNNVLAGRYSANVVNNTYYINNIYQPLSSFTRSTTATFLNSNNIIQTANINQPRVDYTNGSAQLLIEDAATNLLTNSSCDTNDGWGLGPNGIRVGTTTAPDGSNTAVVYTGNASSPGNQFAVLTIILVEGVTYTASVWAKLVSGTPPTTGRLLNINNGSGLSIVGISTEWKRYTLTFVAGPYSSYNNLNSNNNNDFYVCNDWGPNADIAVWGAQIELGSQATSFIPTINGFITRAADVATVF